MEMPAIRTRSDVDSIERLDTGHISVTLSLLRAGLKYLRHTMAENILYDSSESEEEQLYYSLLDNSDGDTETSEELNVEAEEMSLIDSGRKGAKCESCVREKCPWSDEGAWFDEDARYEWCERLREFYGKVAVFFCFLCKIFVCAECLPKHQWHEGQKVEREEGEGMEEQREIERNKEKGLGKETKRMRMETESERKKENEGNESDRMREKGERERKRREYIENFFESENETERTEKLFSSHAVICDRVDVKHELDQTDCLITGLCVLENKGLVVCDFNNYCIKIFELGNHVLQRYIRFVGCEDSGPWDVTEIDLKHNSSEPNLVSGSSSDISVTDRADSDKQCLIAVTLLREGQIMFIDLSKKPAKAQKTIKKEKACYSIQFYDDKIFTVCKEGLDCPYSVYIYSTDGDKLNKFDTGSYGYFSDPDLAVVSGRVYITDEYNHTVECRNVEGQLISEIKIEGSGTLGISVDPDNNVYVCAHDHNKVYKLDAGLTRYMSVLDQTTDYIERPNALCYYRNKLFISHVGRRSLGKIVTVVRLL